MALRLPSNLHMLKGISPGDARGDLFSIEATVPTGLEKYAASEVLDKLGAYPVVGRGRIMFDVPFARIPEVLLLRSVDNVYVIAHMQQEFGISDVPDVEVLQKLCDEVPKIEWTRAFSAWLATHTGKDWNLTPSPGHPEKSYSVDVEAVARQKAKASDAAAKSANRRGGGGGRGRGGGGRGVGGGGRQDRNRNHKHRGQPEAKLANSRVSGGEDLPKETLDQERIPGDGEEQELQDDELKVGEDKSGSNEQLDKGMPEEEEKRVVEAASDQVNGSDEKSEEGSKTTEKVADGRPLFRVTCYRSGDKHKFGSPEAACEFGGACASFFGWPVKMTGYDVEIVLSIEDDTMHVGLRLNQESLYNRNVIEFGPTTMRATLAFGMLQAAGIQPGWIVIDPLCGSGQIPIEGMQAFPKAVFLAGDNYDAAPPRTAKNADFCREKAGKNFFLDPLRWDARSLPIRTAIVDAVVTDLPFGRRMGSRSNNRQVYYDLLEEFARIVRVEWGVAILMTEDYKSITNVLRLPASKRLWRNWKEVGVNVGGLRGNIYILQRSSNPYTPPVAHFGPRVGQKPAEATAASSEDVEESNEAPTEPEESVENTKTPGEKDDVSDLGPGGDS